MESIDLSAYLETAMPKQRGGQDARMERFLEFARQDFRRSIQHHVDRYQKQLALFERREREVAAAKSRSPLRTCRPQGVQCHCMNTTLQLTA